MLYVGADVLANCSTQAQADGIQKLVVGAVVRIDGKFLVLERDPDDFMGGLVELPSGTVGPGEEPLTALAREVAEETGLTVSAVAKYLGSFDYTSGSGKKTRQLNFLVEADQAKSNWTLPSTAHITWFCRPIRHSMCSTYRMPQNASCWRYRLSSHSSELMFSVIPGRVFFPDIALMLQPDIHATAR